ncbi:HTH-type transcriptional repressor GlcR [Oxobacter pfennigii]|uniref:HTH-type transcriptional repressor GlcR n=1 Tax=Oxobacter pfennigii TaxID=36849 RepID=A0A0P8W446_9CLOT|nr:DeoR/GlpR family DNA-binding transcription regulator [Oxobacter pfennigii]KPU42203.1 HTH-type transcriptional repressor GlcR [Oxobacter pfennigii]
MLTEERKKKILQMIDNDGIVQIQSLADNFDVSIYTIRRDLADLEKKGLLKKTHGGAVKVEKAMWLPTVEEGMKEAAAEKKAIAMRASKYIEDGDTIFLMGSTISHAMVPLICDMRLTVVTNSLDVAKIICSYENIETIIIGGKIKNYKGNILGSSAVYEMEKYSLDKAFIPCAGVQAKKGITTSTIDTADFTRAVIKASDENILITDYRKIGRITFSKICNIDQIQRLITDNKADKNELDEIARTGVSIDIVETF